MNAPNDNPTEKTKKRLMREKRLASLKPSQGASSVSKNGQYVEVDMPSLVQELLNNEEVQNEITKKANKRLDTEEAIKTVQTILYEYFDTYILMGYGVDGERTIIKGASNDRDDDSLIEMVRYVFMRMIRS